MKGFLRVVIVLGFAAAAADAARAASIVLPRAGHVGIGFQGQYGTLLKGGKFGNEFGPGGVMAIRLKYRMRYERGIGLSFEQLQLDSRAPSTDSTGAFSAPDPDFPTRNPRERLSLSTEGLDVYQFFRTRTRTTLYVVGGLGLVQASAKLQDGGIQFPRFPDGYYLSAGGGVERFLYRSWALDLSARYMAVLMDGRVNHDLHAAIGMVFYAAY